MGIGQQDAYQATANSIAAQYGVPASLLSNLIGYESSWNPNALSDKGAIGLGQLMPTTAQKLGVQAWDPADNMKGAAALLAGLFKTTGSWTDALSAYYSGDPKSDVGHSYAAGVLSGVQPGGTVVGQALDPKTGLPPQDATGGGIVDDLLNGISGAWNNIAGQGAVDNSKLGLNPSSGVSPGSPGAITAADAAGVKTGATPETSLLPAWATLQNVTQYGVAGLIVVTAVLVGAMFIFRASIPAPRQE